VHDLHPARAQGPRRAHDGHGRAGRGEQPPDADRGHGHASGAKLGLHLAARPKREHLGHEAAPVEQPQHLLEVPLRPTGDEQLCEEGDADHRTKAYAGARRGTRTTVVAGAGSASTQRRMQKIRPIMM
jgi:hypothetical protein